MGPSFFFFPSISSFLPHCLPLLTSSNYLFYPSLTLPSSVFYFIFPSFCLEFLLTYCSPLSPHLTTFLFPYPFFSYNLSLKTNFYPPVALTPATTQHPSDFFGSLLLHCWQPLGNLIRPVEREEQGLKMSATPPKHTHLGEISPAAYKHPDTLSTLHLHLRKTYSICATTTKGVFQPLLPPPDSSPTCKHSACA